MQKIPKTYQLKISLNDTKPLIWRLVAVTEDYTLVELHDLIQVAMGWENKHLFEFEISGQRYEMPDPEDIKPTKKGASLNSKLSKVLEGVKSFKYTYDFGDNWVHEIEIVEYGSPALSLIYPACLGGANACPPEDCGGVPGYEELLKTLKSKNAKDREPVMDWLGGFFDPTTFDPNRINRDILWAETLMN